MGPLIIELVCSMIMTRIRAPQAPASSHPGRPGGLLAGQVTAVTNLNYLARLELSHGWLTLYRWSACERRMTPDP
jgi:hypothetical protein